IRYSQNDVIVRVAERYGALGQVPGSGIGGRDLGAKCHRLGGVSELVTSDNAGGRREYSVFRVGDRGGGQLRGIGTRGALVLEVAAKQSAGITRVHELRAGGGAVRAGSCETDMDVGPR